MRRLTATITLFCVAFVGRTAIAVEYTFEEVSVPGSVSTGIRDINNLDQFVGLYRSANLVTHAFYFDGSEYVTFDYPGADSTTPTAINDHGVIAGHYEIGDSTSGFLYENGEFTSISLPGAQYTQIWGINNSRQIVGSYTRADFTGFGFALEPDGTWRELFGPNNEGVLPKAIANDGVILGSISIQVGQQPFPVQGVLIEDSTSTAIPRFGNHTLAVDDLTDEHLVIGWRGLSPGTGIVSGFVIQDDTISYIDAPGARQTYLVGVNNQRVIVGGTISQPPDSSYAFIARPVREPSSVVIAAVAMLCAVFRARRQLLLTERVAGFH